MGSVPLPAQRGGEEQRVCLLPLKCVSEEPLELFPVGRVLAGERGCLYPMCEAALPPALGGASLAVMGGCRQGHGAVVLRLKPWTWCSLYVGVLLLLEQSGLPLHPGLAGLVQRGGYRVSHGVAQPGEGQAEPKEKLKKLLRVTSGSSAPQSPHGKCGCSPAGEALPSRGLSQSCAATGVVRHPVLQSEWCSPP